VAAFTEGAAQRSRTLDRSGYEAVAERFELNP
jgi:hypothetical protein